MKAELAENLTARGLDIELLSQYGVTGCDEQGPEWVEIPYFVGENVVNSKFRTITHPDLPAEEAKKRKRMMQREGGDCVFWNRNAITDSTLAHLPLLIAEGELDALSAIQAGHIRAVSVPNGAPPKPVDGMGENTSKYDYLEDGLLDGVTEVILAVDGDQSGAYLRQLLERRIGPARCKWVQYPMTRDKTRRLKDLNEVLQVYGEAGVASTIARAEWVHMDGVYTLSQLPPIPKVPAYHSDMPGMNDMYRVRPGDLTVVTGIPGHGKTTWVNDMCCRLAHKNKWRIAWGGFEQVPQTDHRRYLRQWVTGRHEATQNPDELRIADDWIENHFAFITEGAEGDLTLEGTLEKAAAAVKRFGANVLVIDPWNRLEHAVDRNMTMTQYIGRALREFSRFGKHFNTHVIIIAHPKKMIRDGDGNWEFPDLYSISDSSNWYNMVEVGVVVHRVEGKTIVAVQKSKYHDQIGNPGHVECWYNTETGRFSESDGIVLSGLRKSGKLRS